MRYGIYRCHIEVEDKKLIRQNKLDYYTHIDITRARELQFEITLIKDEQPNFYIILETKELMRLKLLDHL